MKKDIIYIDIEDDITAIIEKLKASKAKIVAMVPPKRSTVLVSAVNAKLLKRAAEGVKKRIVLVTNDSSLLAISGALGIHVAKNLQSKPYLPEAPEAPIEEDSVIEGDLTDLDPDSAVGDLAVGAAVAGAATAKATTKDGKKSEKKEKKAKTGKKAFKIPNFEGFRMKLILGGVGAVLLAVVWWWAAFIAPQATVNIVAQTEQIDTAVDYSVNTNVESSDLETKVLKGTVKDMTKTVTEEFTATGEKNVGEKATGTITITNHCYNPGTITAGTQFTSNGGLVFVATADTPVPQADFVLGVCQEQTADVLVRASQSGDSYNLAPTGYTVSGFPSSGATYVVGYGDQMSGGTTVVKKVVSQDDLDKAKANLTIKDYSDEKAEMANLFGEELIGLEDTFSFKMGKVTSVPDVGEEGEKAIMSAEITFSEVGVARADLDELLKEAQEPEIDPNTQSIYDNGLNSASQEIVKDNGKGKYDFRMRAVGIAGPNINTEALAEQITGKRYSEAKGIVDNIPGVVSSEIKLSPFWVNKVPSVSKTTINVEISENSLQ